MDVLSKLKSPFKRPFFRTVGISYFGTKNPAFMVEYTGFHNQSLQAFFKLSNANFLRWLTLFISRIEDFYDENWLRTCQYT